MSKILGRMVREEVANRLVMVSPQYASAGGGSEVTSGRMSADIELLTNAVAAEENGAVAVAERNRILASAYGIDGVAEDKPFVFTNGYAIIPIHGMLINRFSWSWTFATGYNFIRNQAAAAEADPDVTAIIFDINSCGGTVAGCQETADAIYGIVERGEKPVIAVVDSNCHSAAYFIASQCTHIAVTPSGNLGNIGALWVHWDVSEAMAQAGIKVTLVAAGAHKTDGTSYEPLTPEVLADFKAEIDNIYEIFVAAVVRGRGLDDETVRGTEARCYNAADAVALGLADAVEIPSDAIEAYFNSCANVDDDDGGDTETGDDPDADPSEPTETNMTTPTKPGVRPVTTTAAAPAATAVTPPAPVAAAPVTEVTSGTADAVKAERTRVSGIVTHANATGREALAQHLAFNTEMTVEEAAAVMATSPAATAAAPAATAPATPAVTEANNFAAAMNSTPTPGVGASASNSGTGRADDAGTLSPAASILASQRAATGVKAPEKPGTVH